ncbi:hypothetical protein H9P43_001328 [Blastocladiella emersonii ATCC 22665]|nr:hypothetical protein H9P43_001328 [Blastocladiella emersonii ATCC 22665]
MNTTASNGESADARLVSLFGSPSVAAETEETLLALLLQDADQARKTLEYLTAALFLEQHGGARPWWLRGAQFRVLSTVHRAFKCARHAADEPPLAAVPVTAGGDSAQSLGDQLDVLDVDLMPLEGVLAAWATDVVPRLVASATGWLPGPAQTGSLAAAVAVALFRVAVDAVRWLGINRVPSELAALGTLVASLSSLVRSLVPATGADAAVVRRVVRLARVLVAHARSRGDTALLASLAAALPYLLPRFPAGFNVDAHLARNRSELVATAAATDLECVATALLAHLEFAAAVGPAAACALCAGPSPQFDPAAGDALALCAINDKHLAALVLAHLQIHAGDGPRSPCRLQLVAATTPLAVWETVVRDVLGGDATVLVDLLLESAQWLEYLLLLARFLARGRPGGAMTGPARQVLADLHGRLGVLPFATRPLAQALERMYPLRRAFASSTVTTPGMEPPRFDAGEPDPAATTRIERPPLPPQEHQRAPVPHPDREGPAALLHEALASPVSDPDLANPTSPLAKAKKFIQDKMNPLTVQGEAAAQSIAARRAELAETQAAEAAALGNGEAGAANAATDCEAGGVHAVARVNAGAYMGDRHPEQAQTIKTGPAAPEIKQ